jgi:UDP-N-acetylmuramoyl-tripeptide--D-alanyl-D-alanine ligase
VRFSTAELAPQLRGELVGPDVTIHGASIDSRVTAQGQLFIPIIADRDGHDFLPDALHAGAAAYLTSRPPIGGTAIVVDDTRTALSALGAVARGRISSRVLGITGSVGKTTTKDLVHRCLAASFRTAASERSLNNELGVPLTLVNAPDDVEFVVLEMGARGPGHIRELTEMARPDVGVVTSVAMAHMEFFGDLEGVSRAKGELVENLPASGLAVLNFDDLHVRRMAARSPCSVLGFGIDAAADVMAEGISLNDDLQPRFTMTTPWGNGQVALRLHGIHQVPNALAAATAALGSGVPLSNVIGALAQVMSASLRMEVRRPRTGPLLVVDCYNANPASTEAALRSLAALSATRRVALLGVMAELGRDSESEHGRMAALAGDLGVEVIGYQTELYGPGHVSTVGEALARVRELSAHDALLIKGSRMARLEEVLHAYGREIADESLVQAG